MDITQIGIYAAQATLWLFSLASVAVIIERVWALKRAQKLEESDFRALREAFQRGQSSSVRALASKAQGASSAALNAGLEHGSEDVEIMRESIAQEVVVQTSQLQKNLAILATVASTAPYVGLFGTVLGILHAFHTIASTGKTGAAVVAGGISEALVTTALGLGVAIPAVIAYNYFNGWVSRSSLVVETHALDLASRLGPLHAPGENLNNGVPQVVTVGEKA